LLLEIPVKERVVDRLSVAERDNPKKPVPSFSRYQNFAPETNPTILLNVTPDWACEHVRAPRARNMGPPPEYLLFKISRCFQIADSSRLG
jgi:hypothetical protein